MLHQLPLLSSVTLGKKGALFGAWTIFSGAAAKEEIKRGAAELSLCFGAGPFGGLGNPMWFQQIQLPEVTDTEMQLPEVQNAKGWVEWKSHLATHRLAMLQGCS